MSELETELKRANAQLETLTALVEQNRTEQGFMTPKHSTSPERIQKARSLELQEHSRNGDSQQYLKKEDSPLRNVYRSLVEKIDEIRQNGQQSPGRADRGPSGSGGKV